MNNITKRLAALVAAGCLAMGTALADIPSYKDINSWTDEERAIVMSYIGRVNYMKKVHEGSEYIDFDLLGRATPLYAGDRTAWTYGNEQTGWYDVVLLFEDVYSGADQLKEAGVSEYYIDRYPNMMVFKISMNIFSDNLEHHGSMAAYNFDAFGADGGKLGQGYDFCNLPSDTDVYAGGNGSFYVTVYEAEKGCQLRYSFGNDKYMWISSAEKPLKEESTAQ